MGEQFRARRVYHCGIAARVVMVFVGIQHLGDFPALVLGMMQTLFVVQGIDGQRLSGIGTGNEIIEVAPVVTGPDLFDNHWFSSL